MIASELLKLLQEIPEDLLENMDVVMRCTFKKCAILVQHILKHGILKLTNLDNKYRLVLINDKIPLSK